MRIIIIFRFLFFCLFLTFASSYVMSKGQDDQAIVREAHVYHIMVRSREAAHAIQQRLVRLDRAQQFPEFKLIAKAKSVDQASAKFGGDLGVIREGEMTRDFEDAVFAQPLNQVSEPVHTSFGWHLIYVASTSEVPLSEVCEQSLKETMAKATEADHAALEFTFSVTNANQLHPAVLQYLGEGWSRPMKDKHGDLMYFKKSANTMRPGHKTVYFHTEYVHPLYNATPKACRRSARQMFDIDCQSKLAVPGSRVEFEGRAASGRQLMHLGSPPSRIQPTPNGTRFDEQLLAEICAS